MGFFGSYFGSYFGGYFGSTGGAFTPSAPEAITPALVVFELNRLAQQFKDKPNIQGFLSSLLAGPADLASTLQDLLLLRTINTAVGVQLDVLGRLVDQPRNGFVDDDYRRYVRAKIAVNKSKGTVEDVILVCLLIINDSAAQIIVSDPQLAALTVDIEGIVPSTVVITTLISLLRKTVAAGVRILLETLTDIPDLTFFTGIGTFLSSPASMGATTLTVISTSDLPFTGSLDIDVGLGVSETVTYDGKTSTTFLNVSATTNAHSTGASVQLHGVPGLGFGDTNNVTIGGAFASVTE